MEKFRFKGNESFAIRNGWFEKALYVINENPDKNVLSNKDGVHYLGVGSNMVTAIRYWLRAAGIIDDKSSELTEFGNQILKKDAFFENEGTWWLIHYNLASNLTDCPVIYCLFNEVDSTRGKKEMFAGMIMNYFTEERSYEVKKSYIDDDLAVCIKSYCVDPEDSKKTPEDNNSCPLSNLNLLQKGDGDVLIKTAPVNAHLSSLVVYYALLKVYGNSTSESFTVDNAMNIANGPGKIFNLDRHSMLAAVEELQRKGLVDFNRTAGLNTVYFKEKKELSAVIEDILNEDV